jgi:hypothetical protein
MALVLLPEDFVDDAALIGCEVEAVRAVAEVESSGSGFCPDGFPKTLFEGHYFSRLTQHRFDASHPTISYPKWTRQFYGKTWQAERERLNIAISLDRTAALQSASWGMFQVMGANHATCGFKTVQQFVNAMCKGANEQLAVFTTFVIESGLADELRDRRWADFARHYNGPGYAQNNYDKKMDQKYRKLKGLA